MSSALHITRKLINGVTGRFSFDVGDKARGLVTSSTGDLEARNWPVFAISPKPGLEIKNLESRQLWVLNFGVTQKDLVVVIGPCAPVRGGKINHNVFRASNSAHQSEEDSSRLL